jgi:hypothetical protein
MSGRGGIVNGNVQGVVAWGAMVVPDCWLDTGRDDADLRCTASSVGYTETERWRYNPTCSRDV